MHIYSFYIKDTNHKVTLQTHIYWKITKIIDHIFVERIYNLRNMFFSYKTRDLKIYTLIGILSIFLEIFINKRGHTSDVYVSYQVLIGITPNWTHGYVVSCPSMCS